MSTASASVAADRRQFPRLPALHAGKLFMPDGVGVEVVIVDLSQAGARVRLRRVIPVSRDLVLADRATAMAHRATVVWTKDAELGLRLTRSLSLKGVVPGPLQGAKAWCLAQEEAPPPSPAVVHL